MLRSVLAGVLLWGSARAATVDLPMPPPPGQVKAQPGSRIQSTASPAPTAAGSTDTRSATDVQPRLLVNDLTPQGVSPEQAAAFTDAVVQALSGRGVFDVRSSKDVRAVLSAERQRQLFGTCAQDPHSCATDLGSAFGARYVLTGALSQLGGTYELSLQVLDTVRGTSVGRGTRLAHDLSTLRALVPYVSAEAAGTPLPPPASRILQYTLLAAGSAAVLGGGVYGGLALSRQRVLNEELCPGGPATGGQCSRINLRPMSYYRDQDAALGREKSLALGTMVTGAALVALGLYLMPPPEGGPRVAVVPTAHGLGLAGEWR